MTEEVRFYLDEAKADMEKALTHLQVELSKIRAGKASPSMIEDLRVDYYGSQTPVSQVANVATPDARTIVIQPWEKPMLAIIEKAIVNSNLGFNPSNDGILIRITIPSLTEERRRDLAKRTKGEGENTKISVRNIRRDSNEAFKKLQKDGLSEDIVKDSEASIQVLTDKYIARIDEILANKEKEIMTV